MDHYGTNKRDSICETPFAKKLNLVFFEQLLNTGQMHNWESKKRRASSERNSRSRVQDGKRKIELGSVLIGDGCDCDKCGAFGMRWESISPSFACQTPPERHPEQAKRSERENQGNV